MTLDRVPGLEDVEAGDGVDEKTLYDPHTWLDPEKSWRTNPGLSLIKLFRGGIVSIKETYQKNAQAFIKKAQRT